MLRIGCLINSPHVLPQLRGQIEYYIYDAMQNDRRVDAYSVYSTMRKDDIEIDFESFGTLYDNIANRLDPTRAVMTDIDTITDIAKKSFAATMNAVATGGGKNKVQQIGKDSPERVIGNNIASILTTPTITETLMHKLQTAVMVKANEILGVQHSRTIKGTPLEQISNAVTKALELREANDTYGILRQSATLINEVGNEIDRMISALSANGSHKEAVQLQQIKDVFIASITDFLLTKGETARLVNNVLRTAGFINVSGNIAWDRIVDKVQKTEIYTSDEFVDYVKDMLTKQGLSDIEADFIATALEAKYKTIVAEKIAQDTNVPRSTIEKLIHYQQLIDEQPDSEILQQNYAVTMTQALGLDADHAAILGSVTMELGELFKALNGLKYTDTNIQKSLIDRKIALIILRSGVTYKMLGHIMEGLQASRNVLLLNPYNISQNIIGGLLQALTSGKIFGNTWKGTMDAAINVLIGGVDTVRGATDQINVQTAVRDRATSIWRTDSAIMSIVNTPYRILLGLQDIFLSAPDALFTQMSMNNIINNSVEKYIRATSANPEADIKEYYKAFNDPARIALIESEADKIIKALDMPTAYYRKRLINEMLRGEIVTEATSTNTNRILLDAANLFAKMQHGKTPNTSVLSLVTKRMAAGLEKIRTLADEANDRKDESAPYLNMLSRGLSFMQQWIIGGLNWGVIAYDYSGLRFVEIATNGAWNAMSGKKLMAALKETNKQRAIRDIATMADRDMRLRRASFGVLIQVLAVMMDIMAKGDEPPEDYMNNEDGVKKMLLRIGQGFPIFYTYYAYTRHKEERRKSRNKDTASIPPKVSTAVKAALSPMVSRYPTPMETVKDVITGRQNINPYTALSAITDIYSIQGYEAARQWYNFFVEKDEELKRNTYPKSIEEAMFHTGLVRALFDEEISSKKSQEFVGKKVTDRH